MIGLGVYRLHQESGAGHCAVRENQHGHRNGVTQLAAGCTAVGSAVLRFCGYRHGTKPGSGI